MSTKSLKLKTSLRSITHKACNIKSKPSQLKTVLVNPYNKPIERLSNLELYQFSVLIEDEIQRSGLKNREFAKEHGISLGLSSSLHMISNRTASCVLISDTIRPKFIATQIAYFSREKMYTVPVYRTANLEATIQKLFNVKALVVVFPINLPWKISEWIIKRRRNKILFDHNKSDETTPPNRSETNYNHQPDVNLNSYYLVGDTVSDVRAFVPKVVRTGNGKSKGTLKKWKAGDFLSLCTNQKPLNKNRKTILENDCSRPVSTAKSSPQTVTEHGVKAPVNNQEAKIQYEEYDEDYVWWPKYQPAQLRKLHRNMLRQKRKTAKQDELTI